MFVVILNTATTTKHKSRTLEAPRLEASLLDDDYDLRVDDLRIVLEIVKTTSLLASMEYVFTLM